MVNKFIAGGGWVAKLAAIFAVIAGALFAWGMFLRGSPETAVLLPQRQSAPMDGIRMLESQKCPIIHRQWRGGWEVKLDGNGPYGYGKTLSEAAEDAQKRMTACGAPCEE